MNISKKQKFFIGFIITSSILFGVFQNFTTQEQAQLVRAKTKLNNMLVPELYNNCHQAGTTVDGRPSSNQYKCTEYPVGLTSVGMSPSAYDAFMAANPALTPVTACELKARPQRCYTSRGQRRCTSVRSRNDDYEDRYDCSKRDQYNARVTARNNAAAALADWHARKVLINQTLSFRDGDGHGRALQFALFTPRSVIESRPTVVVGNRQVGMRNYGEQRIYKPSGHHFYSHTTDKTGISACTYFPGMSISGITSSTTYTIWGFHKWWGSWDWNIGFTINPGAFSFTRFETCNLMKINPLQEEGQNVTLIGLKAPKFVGAHLSGLYMDLDIGFFGWFVVILLAAICSFLPIIGPLIGGLLITATLLVTEANFVGNLVQGGANVAMTQYDSTAAWDNMLNNIDSSQANIKSGGFIKDVTTMSLLRSTVIPTLQEQMRQHAKIEKLRVIDPASVERYEQELRNAGE